MKYIGQKIYNIESLSSILGVTPAELGYLSLNMRKNVRIRKIQKRNRPSEFREITAPNKKLKVIQRNIKDYILCDYRYEKYIYGLGGNTLKDHAKIHEGTKTLIQVDIKEFYPSISHDLVYKMWIEKFGFPPQVSRILTKVTTMQGGLMQGFPTSSHIAAIVAEDFTKAIYSYCHDNSMKFTQYVDDFNMSGHNIEYRIIFKKIVDIGRAHGLSIKKNKTRVNHARVGKKITGVSLIHQRTRATKEVRQRAIDALKDLSNNPNDAFLKKRVNGYAGFLKHLKKHDGKKYKEVIKKISG